MSEDRDYEAEAKVQGWNSDPESLLEGKWIDAKTFVEKGERIAGIVRSKADREKVQFENRIAKLESANREFGEYKDAQLQRSEARNKELLNELSLRRSQAVSDNDGDAFYKLDKEIEQVRDSMSPPSTNGGPQPNPLFDAWRINNDWYDNDPMLRAIADGIEGDIAQRGFSGPAYYDEVTRKVKEMAPDSFGNKKRSAPTGVEPGGELETKPDSDAHVYDNLPAEAKVACDKFVISGHTTKESYCASYEWD